MRDTFISWRRRLGLFTGALALSLLLLNGCKSQMNNPVFVQGGATNTVVNIDPRTTVQIPTNAPAFTITNPISIFVTNTPVALSNPAITVLLTSSIPPIQITNVILSAAGPSTCSNCPPARPLHKCPAPPCEKIKPGDRSFVDRHFGDMTKIIVMALKVLIALIPLLSTIITLLLAEKMPDNKKLLWIKIALYALSILGAIVTVILIWKLVAPATKELTALPPSSSAAPPPAITLLADAIKTNNARLDDLSAQINREAAALREFIRTNLAPATTNSVPRGDYPGMDEKFLRLEARITGEAQSLREFIRTNDSAASLPAHPDLARQLAAQGEALKRIEQKLAAPPCRKTDCCVLILLVLLIGSSGYGLLLIRRERIRVEATRAALRSEATALRKMAAQIRDESKDGQTDGKATPEYQRERLHESIRICSRLVDGLIERRLRLPDYKGFLYPRWLPELNTLLDVNVRLRLALEKLSELPRKPSDNAKAASIAGEATVSGVKEPAANTKDELATLATEVSDCLEKLFLSRR